MGIQTSVWSSSINKIILSLSFATSFKTPFKRSSKSPRNLAPATRAPKSSASTYRSMHWEFWWKKKRITFLFLMLSGTSPWTMRRARPSTIAVLPTPGSPTIKMRGSVAHASTDEYRIVLRTSRQDLDCPANLLMSTNDRIYFACIK